MARQLSKHDISILQGTSLFTGASKEDLDQILPYFEKKSFAKGDPVFLAQGNCDYVWFVSSGSVEILSYEPMTKESRQIATLSSGQQFAEVAALTGTRHSAGAFSLEDTELLALRVEWFREILSQRPRFAMNLAQWLAKVIDNCYDTKRRIDLVTNIDSILPDDLLIRTLPFAFVAQHKAVPLELVGRRLTIGCLEPLDAAMHAYLRSLNLNLEIKAVILTADQFKKHKVVINKHYATLAATKPSAESVVTKEKIDASELLQFSLLFSQLSADFHEQLLPTLKEVRFKRGEIVSDPNQPLRSILISSGEIEIFKQMPTLGLYQGLLQHSENDVFFDNSIVTGEASSSIGAFALTDVTGIEFQRETMLALLKNKDFILPLATYLAHCLRDINLHRPGLEIFEGTETQSGADQIYLDETFRRQHEVAILSLENHEVSVGTTRLLTTEALTGLQKSAPGYRFREKLASKEVLEKIWSTPAGSKTNSTLSRHEILRPNIEMLKVGNQDVVGLLNRIISEGVSHRASDIHIESREHMTVIRYRIDGSLVRLWEDISTGTGAELVRRAKMLAKMDTAESRLPQDGRFQLKDGSVEIELRVSVVPTRHGEKIAMRVVGKRGEIIPLKQLSSDRRTGAFLNRVTKHRQGIFLVSGPTGSGKSTTLYSMLSALNSFDVNIVTIEDPIEVNVPGISQIEVNTAIDLLPSVLLRHVLRQDPDVIMIGEIRDAESMKLALEASMTGHLVLSTIHSNGALEVLQRLKELGSSSDAIAANLIGVLAQRLVRSLCHHCKKPRALMSDELLRLQKAGGQTTLGTQTMDPVGCAKCYNSGFHGQLPIFEFWERNRQIRSALWENANTEGFVSAVRSSGFESLEQYGLHLVANGLTTFSEIDAVVYGSSWADDLESPPLAKAA